MRTGTAISVFVHVAALTACLILAGVRPFDPTTAEAISVDIVTPDEVPKPKEKDSYEFPKLSEKEQQAPPEPAQQPPPAAEAAKPKEDSKQATLQSGPTEQPPPAEQPKPTQPQVQQQAPAEPQQQQAQPQAEVPTAAPDITSKFGLTFAMPDGPTGDFDAKATADANISVQDAAALRSHIKSCAVLPKSVAPNDTVRIVLRVAFEKDGRLAREPLLIEASASEKGPALMRSAMEALANCQPYSMLPVERYNEWRMLDLSFTPKDFKG